MMPGELEIIRHWTKDASGRVWERKLIAEVFFSGALAALLELGGHAIRLQ